MGAFGFRRGSQGRLPVGECVHSSPVDPREVKPLGDLVRILYLAWDGASPSLLGRDVPTRGAPGLGQLPFLPSHSFAGRWHTVILHEPRPPLRHSAFGEGSPLGRKGGGLGGCWGGRASTLQAYQSLSTAVFKDQG